MSQQHPQDDFAVDDQPTSGPSNELEIYQRIMDSGASEAFWQDVLLSAGFYDDDEYWQQVDAYLDGLFAEAAFGNKIPNRMIQQVKLELARNGYHGLEEMSDALLPNDWMSLDEDEQDAIMKVVEQTHPDKSDDITAVHRGWRDLDSEERAEEVSRLTEYDVDADQADAFRRPYLRARSEEIWSKLSQEARGVALMEHGTDMPAGNAFWKMIAFRHDASGSKGARMLDNLFQRVSEKEVTAKGNEEEAKRMLGLGGGV